MRNDKNFLCPDDMSDKWINRFKVLEFTFDTDGNLYTPKTWDDTWDKQIKCLWLRSVGIAPERIVKRLGVGLSLVKNYWLSKITRYYKLKNPKRYDWSTVGYIDVDNRRHILHGGAQDIKFHGRFKDDGGLDTKISPQLEMDGEVKQVMCGGSNEPEREDIDIYEEYYGDYKD
jgi:hypothetical protein